MGLLDVTAALDKFESFVGVNFWTMLFAWANLLIVYLFLKKLLFKPLSDMISSRQKEIDDMYENAEKSRAEADESRSLYEEKLRAANEESEEILKNAGRRAKLREEEIIREANAEAKRTLERAEAQIELERKNALNSIKNEVSEMAIGIAAAVIERDIKADEHAELIDEFINQMGDENDEG